MFFLEMGEKKGIWIAFIWCHIILRPARPRNKAHDMPPCLYMDPHTTPPPPLSTPHIHTLIIDHNHARELLVKVADDEIFKTYIFTNQTAIEFLISTPMSTI